MALINGRTVAAAALVGLIGGASGAAGAVVAGPSTQSAPAAAPQPASWTMPARVLKPSVALKGCADKKTGALEVIGAGTRNTKCARGEVPVRFTPPGPGLVQPDGSLRMKSPDGRFELVVSDAGVGMRGPGGQFSIDQFGLDSIDKSELKIP